MSFRNKSIFFVPKENADQTRNDIPLVAASNIYTCGKDRVLRIVVGSTARFVIFIKDRADATPADATNGILLPANDTVFISTADFQFMKTSGTLDQVLITEDKG